MSASTWAPDGGQPASAVSGDATWSFVDPEARRTSRGLLDRPGREHATRAGTDARVWRRAGQKSLEHAGLPSLIDGSAPMRATATVAKRSRDELPRRADDRSVGEDLAEDRIGPCVCEDTAAWRRAARARPAADDFAEGWLARPLASGGFASLINPCAKTDLLPSIAGSVITWRGCRV